MQQAQFGGDPAYGTVDPQKAFFRVKLLAADAPFHAAGYGENYGWALRLGRAFNVEKSKLDDLCSARQYTAAIRDASEDFGYTPTRVLLSSL